MLAFPSPRRWPHATAVAALLVLARSPMVAAGTYTVAASGGDFTAIQAALNVAVAGDTIDVREKPTLPFAQDPAVTVQLRRSGGGCWGSSFAAPATRNDGAQFKDKLD